MAKELPYFKFEPNQWENGNIQMFSHEQKGVFIDLCSMYWSRLGELPYKLAVQKICNGNATALDSLYEENIFVIKDGFICIDFLNEQLVEFESLSKTNSENARIGWEKRRKNATAKRNQSERNAIREEEKKEEEKKEEEKKEDEIDIFVPKIKEKKFNFKESLINYGFDKNLVEDWLLVRKNKKATNTQTAFNSFITEVESRDCNINEILTECVKNSWSGFKHVWIDNLNKNNKNGGEKSSEQVFRDAIKSEAAQYDYFK